MTRHIPLPTVPARGVESSSDDDDDDLPIMALVRHHAALATITQSHPQSSASSAAPPNDGATDKDGAPYDSPRDRRLGDGRRRRYHPFSGIFTLDRNLYKVWYGGIFQIMSELRLL